MNATAIPNSQHKPVQVYFLAAPEDQDVCEVIHKYLKPIIRSSKIPIEVNSDFNIPSGADTEKYKERLFEADIVLALISSDFIANDDTYNRNQQVSERHNNPGAVIIPILVRNCLWRSTPFKDMHVLPKNQQPLNNKQFWGSPDDAVTAVVEDIYTSINDLTHAFAQRAAMQPAPAAKVESTSDLVAPVETSISQPVPDNALTELPPAQSAAVQPAPAAELESAPDLTAPVETSITPAEPDSAMNELPPAQSAAVRPLPVPEMQSVPNLKAPSEASIRPTISQVKASAPMAADWRQKYYRAVALKRAGAILLDHIILYIALIIILLPFAGGSDEFLNSAINWVFLILYFVIMPIMESSKWQGTLGKRIMKLQITDRQGDRITFLRAFWRNVMRTVVLYSYVFVIPLILQYFRFNKTRKLFHDELSGTEIGERLTSSRAAQVAVNRA